MAAMVTEMLIMVDLQCLCCYKKIRKVILEIPQIRDMACDVKKNLVLITVVACSPKKIRDKIICKGRQIVLGVQIVPAEPKEVRGNPSANSSEPVHDVSPHGSSRRRITSWQKGELLGSGSFGSVYKGFHNHDRFFFAIKEVSLLDPGSRGEERLSQLQQEISLLSQFDHENIVRYLGSNKDDTNLYIFLELMTERSLETLYRKFKLGDSQVSAYTRQILNGLKYLHDREVVHRDIKCANILVDASGSVKLADFGLAKAIEMNSAKTSIGSGYWMAPEVVNQKRRSSQLNGSYGLEADIWSLGCTVLEMLTSQHPYPGLEPFQAAFKSAQGEPPQVPDSLSREARDFILICLQVNPNDRPTAAVLLDHPFVRN